jgi:hypothetical protein
LVTGPHALYAAFREFCYNAGGSSHLRIYQAGTGRRPVSAGTYMGTWNYSVTVYGQADKQNEFVKRDALGGINKRGDYKVMGMRHFLDDRLYPTGRSCLASILEATRKEPRR